MAADQFHGLDTVIFDHDYLYMLLFNLIIRHDERLRKDVVEAIRHILQNQTRTHPVSPIVQRRLQALLDSLLKPAPQEATVEVTSAHPVRLVK